MERTVDDKTLDELMAAHAASQQGEWFVTQVGEGRYPLWWVECDEKDEHTEGTVTVAECLWREGADARFTALAHNTIPRMVDELRQCRKELTELRSSVGIAQHYCRTCIWPLTECRCTTEGTTEK